MISKGVSVLLIAAGLQLLATYGAANPIPDEPAVVENNAEEDGHFWEKGGLFEGDIVLDKSKFRNGRLWLGRPVRFLSKVIPVVIDGAIGGGQRDMIYRAFGEYHQRTCIRFQETNANYNGDHIYIKNNGPGCNSQVGRTGGRQFLNLQNSNPGSGCFTHGIIVHELLHALGFWHQHSAANRDDFVNIIWQNIPPQEHHNFQKYSPAETTSFGIGYDYNSIMHYGTKAFSANGGDTIVPRRPGVAIGQMSNLSHDDIRKLHIMYGC